MTKFWRLKVICIICIVNSNGEISFMFQAPFDVVVHVSTLLLMDAHAHTSRAEVMGLLGGRAADGDGAAPRRVLAVSAYRPAAAAAGSTHCDMDPGNLCRTHITSV